jgi:magnesium chelatase accessory protein
MPALRWCRDGADWPLREASEFVEAAGIRWHMQRMGRGPPLVLVHGTGAASHSWRGLAPILAKQFTVIAPDLPGHGFTQSPAAHRLTLPAMAADLGRLLRVLEIQPDIVVGHSAGAAILARMCLDGRIAPRLLVSLNGAFLPFGGVAGFLFSPLAKLLALGPFVPGMFSRLASDTASVERMIGGTGSRPDRDGIALYQKLLRSPAHVGSALRMMANWELAPLVRDLPALTTKLVLVAAENDRAISPHVSERVHAIVLHSAIERVYGVGHLAHEEHPALIARRIMAHAAQAGLAIESSPTM